MFNSLDELQIEIQDILRIDNEEISILNLSLLQQSLIDKLIYTAIFADDEKLKDFSRQIIKNVAKSLGVYSASIKNLYTAIGKGEINKQFTVPAMNIRTLTYDTARIIFRLAKEKNIGPFVFEISRTEMDYTHQHPNAYTSAVLAAAIKEDYQGPVFLQGDHFQFSLTKYKDNPQEEQNRLKTLIDEAITGQFYNIDIDASTLVDLTKENLDDQQKDNYENTALLTKYIREKQPKDIEISIGAEIGHIGDRNSTVGDLNAFTKGFLPLTDKVTGISKISIQTGTSHGGIPLPDGTVAPVNLDFNVIRDLGKVAREQYHLGGVVQHGASTLSNDMFHLFPENQTLEIHLATGFQNIIYDNMPSDLRQKMYQWIDQNLEKEKDTSWNEQQFLYKLRKKALGPFEKELWELSEDDKKPMLQGLESELRFLFEKLEVFETKQFLATIIANPAKAGRSNPVKNSVNENDTEKIAALSRQSDTARNDGGGIKTITDVKIENKKVLLRVDFDVSLNPNYTIANDTRITQTLPTIKQLLANKNKLIILSHLGRPEGRDPNLSLKPVVEDLQKHLTEYKVSLVDDFLSDAGKQQLANQQENEILMLENTRFYPGEKGNDEEFAKQLAALGEIYVNDAFAVCHRNDASVVGLPKLLPHYAGLLLQKEITAISHILQNPKKPIVAIIGGAKTSDKLPLLYKLTEIADQLLLGGGIANTFLKTDGFNIGNSLHEDGQEEEVKKILAHAKDKKTVIVLPRDVMCALGQDAKQGTEYAVNHIPVDNGVVDIGSETEAMYGNIIANANTIIWNGPVGYIENPVFSHGTEFLYYAITQNNHAYSLVGGGDTLNAISKKEYLDKITHISTGGGAMLEFIEKGTLPGIEALKKNK